MTPSAGEKSSAGKDDVITFKYKDNNNSEDFRIIPIAYKDDNNSEDDASE